MKSPTVVFAATVLIVASFAVPTSSQTTKARAARPGSVNYVEGQASIGNQTLGANSAGSMELGVDETLTTETGKVEILLTPGVFLRLGDHSSVKMISPGLADTIVELQRGRALVEVLDINKNNNIRVNQEGVSTKIINKGLYEFDANRCQILVFKGKAEVYEGPQKATLSDEREVTFTTGPKLTPRHFEPRQYTDDLYRWSGLRSAYLSEASVDTARIYVGTGPSWYAPGWYGPGWYWSPWYFTYTFLPADGIFYSPFGWGFYSPVVVYRSPFFYFGYHGSHPFGEFHGPYGHGFEPRGGRPPAVSRRR